MMQDMNIFLLIGQSNMAGRGEIGSVPVLSHPNILMLRQGQWMPAVEPLHTDKESAGVGLGMSFAFELTKKYPESKIGLVPCAFGGTPLSRWIPGADLYENAVATTKQALSGGALKGILWHQGESDASDQNDSSTYGQRFSGMIAGLREEFSAHDVPVITGELGEFLTQHEGCEYFTVVNDTFNGLVETLSLYRCASSAGLKAKEDNVHFDAASLREFGRRYAVEYMSILNDNGLGLLGL